MSDVERLIGQRVEEAIVGAKDFSIAYTGNFYKDLQDPPTTFSGAQNIV